MIQMCGLSIWSADREDKSQITQPIEISKGWSDYVI